MSRFLAIDVDPHAVYLAVGRAGSGSVKVDRVLSWEGGLTVVSDATAKAFGERLKDKLKAAGIAAAPVLLGIGRERIFIKDLRYPPVPSADEPNLVRFQALKDGTEAPDDLIVDYVPRGEVNGERHATAVVLNKEIVRWAQAMTAVAGLKLAAVTPRPFVAEAVVAHAGAAPDEAVGLLTLGQFGGEFTVVRGSDVLFARTVPAPVVAAEASLVGDMKRNLAVYTAHHPDWPLVAVYVPERAGAGWADAVADRLSLPVVDFDPVPGLSDGESAADHGRFAAALGLLAAQAAGGAAINLTAPRKPVAQADPFRRKLVIAGVVGFLLLGAGVGFGVLELEKAGRTLQQLQLEKLDLESTRARLAADAKRVRYVEEWEGQTPIWLDELYDLADRFDQLEDTRVTSIVASTIKLDKAGKRPASGRMEMKLGTRNPDTVTDLVSEINRDNTADKKHYVSVQKATNGLASGDTLFNQLFTITVMINRRSPDEYVRQLDVTVPAVPPKATGGRPSGGGRTLGGPSPGTAPPPAGRPFNPFAPNR